MISRQLKSFYSGAFGRVGREDKLLEQTSNLETNGGYLYLLHQDEKVVQQILLFFQKIRQGGQIVVPDTTYRHLPYGMDGIEILMKHFSALWQQKTGQYGRHKPFVLPGFHIVLRIRP